MGALSRAERHTVVDDYPVDIPKVAVVTLCLELTTAETEKHEHGNEEPEVSDCC